MGRRRPRIVHTQPPVDPGVPMAAPAREEMYQSLNDRVESQASSSPPPSPTSPTTRPPPPSPPSRSKIRRQRSGPRPAGSLLPVLSSPLETRRSTLRQRWRRRRRTPRDVALRVAVALFALLAIPFVLHLTPRMDAAEDDRILDVPTLLESLSRDKGELRPLGDVAFTDDGDDDEEEPLGAKTTFLLGIFSTLSEQERRRRELIRQTYLSSSTNSSQQPTGRLLCSLPDYEGRDAEYRSGCRIVYAFVVGANPNGPTERVRGGGGVNDGDDAESGALTLTGATAEDITAEPDVVHLNIKENMEDGKTPSWFGYGVSLAESYGGGGTGDDGDGDGDGSGIDYIGKTDSDTQLNVEELLRTIRRDLPPTPHNRRTYGGRPLIDFVRSGTYMAGEFYFASTDLARYVALDMTAEQRRYLARGVEDADFGAWVSSHPRGPLKMATLSNHLFWHHPLKSLNGEGQWRLLWNARGAVRAVHRERMVLVPGWMRYAVAWFG